MPFELDILVYLQGISLVRAKFLLMIVLLYMVNLMLRRGMKDLLGFLKHNSEQGDKEESDSFANCFGDTDAQ